MSDDTLRALIKDGTYPINGCSCTQCNRARTLLELDAKVMREGMPPPFALGAGSVGNSQFPPGAITYVDEANPKDVLGAAKPSMGLIPVGAMEAVARVMELGAKKYGPYNWRSKKVKLMVYANAALRHLFKWIGGESIDEESGQSHLAHAAACLFIMLDADKTGNAIDDREWPHN